MNRYSSYSPRSVRKKELIAKRNLFLTLIFVIALIFISINWVIPILIGGLSLFNSFKSGPKEVSISEDESLAPPVLTIPYEATNSAIIRIKGYSTPKSKVKIFLDDIERSIVESQEDGTFVSDPLELSIGVNNIYGKSVGENSNESLPSKTIRVTYNSDAPRLEISEPDDGKEIKGGDKKVKIVGSAEEDTEVDVNGLRVIINADGTFVKEVPLNEGENILTITATNIFGNTTKIERKVIFVP